MKIGRPLANAYNALEGVVTMGMRQARRTSTKIEHQICIFIGVLPPCSSSLPDSHRDDGVALVMLLMLSTTLPLVEWYLLLAGGVSVETRFNAQVI